MLTILLTSTKWSETFSPVVSQLSLALFIELVKLRYSAYPKSYCSSLANQYSTPFCSYAYSSNDLFSFEIVSFSMICFEFVWL